MHDCIYPRKACWVHQVTSTMQLDVNRWNGAFSPSHEGKLSAHGRSRVDHAADLNDAGPATIQTGPHDSIWEGASSLANTAEQQVGRGQATTVGWHTNLAFSGTLAADARLASDVAGSARRPTALWRQHVQYEADAKASISGSSANAPESRSSRQRRGRRGRQPAVTTPEFEALIAEHAPQETRYLPHKRRSPRRGPQLEELLDDDPGVHHVADST